MQSRAELHPDRFAATFDIKNASGSVKKLSVLRVVLKVVPIVARFVLMLWGLAAAFLMMRQQDGSFYGHRSMGWALSGQSVVILFVLP